MTVTKLVPATTPGGKDVVVLAVDLDAIGGDDLGTGGDTQVSGGVHTLDDALAAVQDLSDGFRKVIEAVTPTKATVEFSIAFALQAGKLTALFVDGKTEGSMTITLEWEKQEAKKG
jgi:Trypsin-co-occurring domain 1